VKFSPVPDNDEFIFQNRRVISARAGGSQQRTPQNVGKRGVSSVGRGMQQSEQGQQQQRHRGKDEGGAIEDERGWWERPEEVSMAAYAVEPLEPWQEERLETAYALQGRRKMKVVCTSTVSPQGLPVIHPSASLAVVRLT